MAKSKEIFLSLKSLIETTKNSTSTKLSENQQNNKNNEKE
jgi:hypothetical protein